jgi:hypothetical protein
MKIAIIWDVMPCSLVHRYQCLEDTCCQSSSDFDRSVILGVG